MHFEILVEDASGKIALEHIVPKILGSDSPHSFRIKSYKGIGRLPRDLRNTTDPRKRILLDQLPRILRGYGKSLHPRDQYGVIVVVDSDARIVTYSSKSSWIFSNGAIQHPGHCSESPLKKWKHGCWETVGP